MPRYALLIEYDGAPFVGWQRQAQGLSVQALIEDAAAPLNAGTPGTTTAAGRTDAGVHAEGQVALLEIAADLPPERLREALNARTRPHPVSVIGAAAAPEGWNARFSATRRSYRYRILNRRARPALDAGRVWHVPAPLDAGAMHAAARGLLGKHDFSAYRAAACQAKDPTRTLDRLDVLRHRDELVIVAEARSFLHHQVRNLVGTLAQVGHGRRPVTWPRSVLDGRDRTKAGQTAPPDGLTLISVGYEPPIAWL